MKATELRPGNFVNVINRSAPVHIPGSQVFRVLEIKAFTASILLAELYPAQHEWHQVDLKDLSPIPLSEELLLRAEFKKTRDSGSFDNYWTGAYISLTSDYELSTSTRNYDTQPVDGSKQFKYFHELQNIVFDLTGKELTLKTKI